MFSFAALSPNIPLCPYSPASTLYTVTCYFLKENARTAEKCKIHMIAILSDVSILPF